MRVNYMPCELYLGALKNSFVLIPSEPTLHQKPLSWVQPLRPLASPKQAARTPAQPRGYLQLLVQPLQLQRSGARQLAVVRLEAVQLPFL